MNEITQSTTSLSPGTARGKSTPRVDAVWLSRILRPEAEIASEAPLGQRRRKTPLLRSLSRVRRSHSRRSSDNGGEALKLAGIAGEVEISMPGQVSREFCGLHLRATFLPPKRPSPFAGEVEDAAADWAARRHEFTFI